MKTTTNNASASIITSDRYIAIETNGQIVNFNTVRILQANGEIIPARWNKANARLESVAINNPNAAVMMYEKSGKIDAKLKAAGIKFQWMALDQAKELTS